MAKTLINQKIIFIDFDDVLLNTAAFKKDYFASFRKFGVSPLYAEACFRDLIKERGQYEPHEFIRRLRKAHRISDSRKLISEQKKLEGQTGAYVYPDAEPFLRFLHHGGWRVELVSSGNYAMQKRRIIGSGLTKFFHGIHIVPKTLEKGREMKRVLNGRKKRFVFIDDVKIIVEDVKKRYPLAYVIQMFRPHKKQRAKNVDAVVGNFSSVRAILIQRYEKKN